MKGKSGISKRRKVTDAGTGATTFYESPEDPYFLPSDAEAEEVHS